MVGSNLYVHPKRKVFLWLCGFFAVKFSCADENSDEKIISKKLSRVKIQFGLFALVFVRWWAPANVHRLSIKYPRKDFASEKKTQRTKSRKSLAPSKLLLRSKLYVLVVPHLVLCWLTAKLLLLFITFIWNCDENHSRSLLCLIPPHSYFNLQCGLHSLNSMLSPLYFSI